MRFVTKTRLEYLKSLLLQSIEDSKQQKEALQLLESIGRDIGENYAEIQRPARLMERS